MLLTFSSGGQADLLARTVSEKMRTTLGQPIVIEPKPGAGGNLAMEATAKAPADGYTMVFGTPAVAINGKLYKQLGYDPVKDLTPLSLAAWGPYIVYVSGALPVNSMSELIAYAKARPNELNYASVGIGSGTHLAAVLFTLAAGVQMTHVPYKGIQQIAPDLVAGSVHLTFNAYGPLAQFVQSGRIRMLATTAARRIPSLPDLPTIAESGIPGYEAGTWFALAGPAGMPREVTYAIYEQVKRVLNEPALREKLIEKQWFEVVADTPDDFAAFLQKDYERWERLIRLSGVKVE